GIRACALLSFGDTATPLIYSLSLHDALPISKRAMRLTPPKMMKPRPITTIAAVAVGGTLHALKAAEAIPLACTPGIRNPAAITVDRKSTRLNSSHVKISYAVFCLKKKNEDDT